MCSFRHHSWLLMCADLNYFIPCTVKTVILSVFWEGKRVKHWFSDVTKQSLTVNFFHLAPFFLSFDVLQMSAISVILHSCSTEVILMALPDFWGNLAWHYLKSSFLLHCVICASLSLWHNDSDWLLFRLWSPLWFHSSNNCECLCLTVLIYRGDNRFRTVSAVKEVPASS